MMNDKRGFIAIIWIIVIVAVIALLASVFGLLFFNKLVSALGSTKIIIAVLIVLALVFHTFVEAILFMILNFIKSILKV